MTRASRGDRPRRSRAHRRLRPHRRGRASAGGSAAAGARGHRQPFLPVEGRAHVLRDRASATRRLLPHDPFKAIVAPRPIGWISTRALDGRINLAPYSFFNAFASSPPIVGFSSEGYKDSAAFARDSGEFVANLASRDLMQAMSQTSAPLPRGDNEFEHAGLTMAPCRLVKAPRVAEAHAALECKVVEVDAAEAPQRRGDRQLSGARRSRRLPYRRRADPRRPFRHRRRAAARALRLSGLRGRRNADRAGAAGRAEKGRASS